MKCWAMALGFLVVWVLAAGIADGISKHGLCLANCTTVIGK